MWWRRQSRGPRWVCRESGGSGSIPWHELIGESVSLSPFTDRRTFYKLMDDHVREGQGYNDDPIEVAPEWSEQPDKPELPVFHFQICAFGSPRPLGYVGISLTDSTSAEIGYWMGAKGRGRGYTSEAAVLATKFALGHLGMSSVTAETAQDNTASVRVAQRAGLSIVGTSSTVRPNGKTFECYLLARSDGPFPDVQRCTATEHLQRLRIPAPDEPDSGFSGVGP